MRRQGATSRRQRVLAIGLTLGLAACSAVPPPRFHTLMPPPADTAPALAPAGPLVWEVLPVTIPAQVDQPQWVVQAADGSLAVLEQERWIAPLAEEIRAALVAGLTRSLGPPAASSERGKLWRVAVDVQRFESVPGREARLEATWTLGPVGDAGDSLRCRVEFKQAVAEGGYLALAKGHQTDVARLADVIANALKAVRAGLPASCEG